MLQILPDRISVSIFDCVYFQALDSNFTEENRQKCAEAAKPLVNAVEELTTFASSPEFASKQAKISPKVRYEYFIETDGSFSDIWIN